MTTATLGEAIAHYREGETVSERKLRSHDWQLKRESSGLEGNDRWARQWYVCRRCQSGQLRYLAWEGEQLTRDLLLWTEPEPLDFCTGVGDPCR